MSNSIQSHAQAQKERRITSLEIAQLSGKPHNDLLKSIRRQEVGWNKVTQGNFSLSEYTDSSGRKLSMYEFTQAESLYIASKFDDEVRARLVIRWMELEYESRKRRRLVSLREDERMLLALIDQHLLIGDQAKIAKELGVRRTTVNAVKCGRTRSARIMGALVDQAIQNQKSGRQLVIGYSADFVDLAVRKLKGGLDA